eukprot:6197293-Pleurochrysis_carterae.AAC.1
MHGRRNHAFGIFEYVRAGMLAREVVGAPEHWGLMILESDPGGAEMSCARASRVVPHRVSVPDTASVGQRVRLQALAAAESATTGSDRCAHAAIGASCAASRREPWFQRERRERGHHIWRGVFRVRVDTEVVIQAGSSLSQHAIQQQGTFGSHVSCTEQCCYTAGGAEHFRAHFHPRGTHLPQCSLPSCVALRRAPLLACRRCNPDHVAMTRRLLVTLDAYAREYLPRRPPALARSHLHSLGCARFARLRR